MDLRAIGLDHLMVFQELMTQRRVSRVADRLGLTQPAISNTLAKLRKAPGVSLSTVRNTAVNLRDEMAGGKVHRAIGLLPGLKAGFFQRRLFTQRYVCRLRRGHALVAGRFRSAPAAPPMTLRVRVPPAGLRPGQGGS